MCKHFNPEGLTVKVMILLKINCSKKSVILFNFIYIIYVLIYHEQIYTQENIYCKM